MDIRNSLLIVSFGISAWEAKRQDRKATKEVADNHGTATSVGRYHKDLLPHAQEHRDILTLRNAWRVWHTENSLAWNDDGARVIKSSSFLDYSAGYTRWKDQFEAACSVFYGAYPSLVAKAQMHLNTLFDPKDYPKVDDLRGRFSVRMNLYPVPNADDFRIMDGIDAADAEALREQAVAGLQSQVTEALKDLWGRMHAVVTAMQTRLDIPHGQPGGKFHDTITQNIADLLVCISKLNLTNDPEITHLSEEMQELLVAPDALRCDPDLRAEKAALAKTLASRMKQYV
jgi:hypothetical protein